MARTSRYEDLGLMNETEIHVIGVGAIGRQVALTLAIMGWPGKIHIYDFDTVEDVNLGTQGFAPSELEGQKVYATQKAMHYMNPDCDVECHEGRVTKMGLRKLKGGYVFSCVDSMATRQMIYENAEPELFLDARMAAEVFTVLAVYSQATSDMYSEGLFTDDEAFQGACTAKSTYYCANISAGFMIAQMTKFVRGFPIEADVRLDLAAMGIITSYAPVEAVAEETVS